MVSIKKFAVFFVISFTLIFGGCTNPSLKFHQQAKELGFHAIEYHGTKFTHQIYRNQKALGHSLHVYLGSDGTPWETLNTIASDPTPRNPIMLRLMALDSATSIYVGRPCYHGFSQSPGCHPQWWTSGRYSEPVVESLASVLKQIFEQEERSIVLFGYSGGGALALLLADRLSFVEGVVTIAGNLDIEAWTDYHSFSALTGSLNPASLPFLGNQLVQIHFLGKQDKVVPPHVVKKTIHRQGNHSRVVIEDIDHQCCWETLWPGLLRTVNEALEKKEF